MFTWAKLISVINQFLKFMNEVSDYVQEQKSIAQGKAEQAAKQRAEDDKRILEAARARDNVIVTDGMQSVDAERIRTENDPNNRDNWNN